MGGGKVKGQLSLRPVGTLVVRERMGKALAVQSGRALPMGRCASPPCVEVDHNAFTSIMSFNLPFFRLQKLFTIGLLIIN